MGLGLGLGVMGIKKLGGGQQKIKYVLISVEVRLGQHKEFANRPPVW